MVPKEDVRNACGLIRNRKKQVFWRHERMTEISGVRCSYGDERKINLDGLAFHETSRVRPT
jgi:hypothetical protein